MSKELKLGYGALQPSLYEQLDDQGFHYSSLEADKWEMFRKAALTLHLNGLLTDAPYDKVLAKLHKRITDHLNERQQDL